MRQTKTFLYALLAFASIPTLAFAHGSVVYPASRAYTCYLENPEYLKSAACIAAKEIGGTPPAYQDGKQAMYDWFEINQANGNDNHQAVVPNGTLCAGGKDKYRGFNQARTDWVTTNIIPDKNGEVEFSYLAHAPHRTQYFKFYVTKDGWDQSLPLGWENNPNEKKIAELEKEPFATFFGDAQEKIGDGSSQKYYKEVIRGVTYYKMKAKLPPNKTGQHIIYNVWQRPVLSTPYPGIPDSNEAFYACSDVNFVGGSGLLATPLFNNPWK